MPTATIQVIQHEQVISAAPVLAAARPKGNGNARMHGLNSLKTTVVKLGGRAADGRYRIGRQLQKWRRELIADLGGQDSITTQQRALVGGCRHDKADHGQR